VEEDTVPSDFTVISSKNKPKTAAATTTTANTTAKPAATTATTAKIASKTAFSVFGDDEDSD
jgi:hypothetical protein